MTVFVDQISTFPTKNKSASVKRLGDQWCHMWCDGDIEELHILASKIGLKRSFFQDHHILKHYDLIPRRREKAIELGAVEASLKDWIRKHRHE